MVDASIDAAKVVIGSLKIRSQAEKAKFVVRIMQRRSYRSANSVNNTSNSPRLCCNDLYTQQQMLARLEKAEAEKRREEVRRANPAGDFCSGLHGQIELTQENCADNEDLAVCYYTSAGEVFLIESFQSPRRAGRPGSV